MTKESFDKLPCNAKEHFFQGKGYESGTVKPDLVMKMSEKTFDALSEGKLSGFKGWLTGSVKVQGSTFLAGKWDDKVVRRYNMQEAYSKTSRRD